MVSEDSRRKSAPAAGWLGWKIFSWPGQSTKTLAGLAILILIASGLDIAVPFLTRGMIDKILLSIQAHRAGTTGVLRTLLAFAAAIFAAMLVNRILRSHYNYRLVRAVTQAEDEVKTAAFANFLVPPLLIVIGVLVSLLLRNPWIALLVFVPLPAYVLAINRRRPGMQTLERGNQYAANRLRALAENAQTLIVAGGRVGVMTLGGYFVVNRQCTVGDYVLFPRYAGHGV